MARKKEYFNYFISRKGFNFEGLGEKIANRLIDEGIVNSPADLFFLKKEELLSLDGFQDKLADNIINSIKEKKEIDLAKFIYSLGIENVGEETARLLKKEFHNLDKIKEASLDDFLNIKDIGEITAEKIFEWFQDKENLRFLDKLKKAGVAIKQDKKLEKKINKTFVFTGSLKSLSRDSAREKILDLGGKVSQEISSKTDFLVVGDNPGSKLKRAEELNVKRIDEKEFLRIISL